MERLQKVIAASGVCSRRKAEQLIKWGKVRVNGEVITELGTKVSDSDTIIVNNRVIEKEVKEYYLLNKPRGIVTTTVDDKNRKTVVDLIDTTSRIYPVGRLDYDTTGVLLLTNDGDFANIVMHPKYDVSKTYFAKLDGIIRGDAINSLKEGVAIDEIFIRPSRVKLKKVDPSNNVSFVQITINEGRNHQVKRMFEAVGFKVVKLKREKEGFFDLKGVNPGEYRKLTPKEVAKVYGLHAK